MFKCYYDSPIGILKIESDGEGIISNELVLQKEQNALPDHLCMKMIAWLEAYFCGSYEPCTVPMKLNGTEFQKKVLAELYKIPYGSSVTYGELAERAGVPRAYRAVGSAVGKNPFLIAIPCHRVISANGVGGFSAIGGVDTKKKLLHIEGVL